MRRQLTAAIATLVLAASPVWAANGNIGLFFDESAAICQQEVPAGTSTVLYVYALLQGASQTGITGAEYKVQVGPDNTADQGWLFAETFYAPTVLGGAFNPADNALRGVNVAWADCQVGDGTKVLIETVTIFNVSATMDEVLLRVVKHDDPSNQFFQCPLFTLCDIPVYTKVCLGSDLRLCQNPEPPFPINATCSTSGEAFLNPGPGRNCTVAVQETDWSTIKGLYRN